MAKVSGPLMSLDASGQIGKTAVFAKWKGRNYVRKYVTPMNPQSVAQVAQRAALGAAGRLNSFVEALSPAQTSLNALAPSDQSGVSFYARKMIERYAACKSDYNNATYSDEKGYFDSAATALGIVEITVNGDTPETVSPGLILWVGYQAMHDLDATKAPSAANAATAGNITTFTTSLAAA